ncbi:MAG: PKD domain-containing protein [Parachlamydiaceae bacterium]|nr:MAG: PKD domain-containing protein [Parachlamydiaceae bacterium]
MCCNYRCAWHIHFFDASKSVSPVGTIVSYAWNFGDGQTAVTTSPFISHTYATTGVFNVTLVVTNSAGTSTAQTFPGTTMEQNGGSNAIFIQSINISFGQPPLPPSNFIGRQIKNIFATQTDLINQLTWQPSPDSTIIGYLIRRNGTIITEICSQGPFIFNDHNRRKNEIYIYTLTALSAGGESTPLTITLP